MTEKIKITSIKLQNYRQYFENHDIQFPSREDGFAVIVGENGAGKSNLLNAINWCFYKKEPHAKKNTEFGIINQKYLNSVPEQQVAEMSVQIDLQKGGDHYRVSRVLKVLKNEYKYDDPSGIKKLKMTNVHGYLLPLGCEVLESQSTFEILIKREHEHDFHVSKDVSTDVLMNEILPESLSSYFILDGEFLEKFWYGIQRVQIGIEQISQLHLISSTSDHLKSFKKNIPIIGDQQIDQIGAQIRQIDYYENSLDNYGNRAFSKEPRYGFDDRSDENEFYHSTGKPRKKDLEEDILKIDRGLEEITDKFATSGIDYVKSRNNDMQKIQKELDSLADEEQKAKKEYFSSMVTNIPLFFLKPAIKYSIDLVDTLRAKGKLPYTAKKIFTNDLLERGQCICQNDLKSNLVNGEESNQARAEVIKVRDNMEKDQGLDSSVEMKYYFEEALLDNFDNFTEKAFDSPRINFSKIKNKFNERNQALKEVKIQLQNLGNVDIDQLTQNHTHLQKLGREKHGEIKDIEYKLKENGRKLADLERERQSLLKKSEKTKKIAHEQTVWDNLFTVFEKAYSELKKEIKADVEEKTMEIFLKTMYKKNAFKKFIIHDSFNVELINHDDVSMLGSLSAGESLFLALSFISAIRDVTGFKFPLIIDTPLGRVSGTPRHLLSQALPDYLPNEQIIFLATDTEFLNPDVNVHDVEGRPELAFGQLLEEAINVRYYLIKGMEHNIARIVDYTPRWRPS